MRSTRQQNLAFLRRSALALHDNLSCEVASRRLGGTQTRSITASADAGIVNTRVLEMVWNVPTGGTER
jgi:hypothetical protein